MSISSADGHLSASTMSGRQWSRSHRAWTWAGFLVVALLLLDPLNGPWYAVVVPGGALVLAAVPGTLPGRERAVDRRDLLMVGVLYAGVVTLFALAFRVFTQDDVLGLFLCFGAGMLLGVLGPIGYTVWWRRRPLADLGLTTRNAGRALTLGAVLGVVQFALTLWGYQLPRPVAWMPLLVLSLTVGVFESVFFRGFVQTRLEHSLGTVPGVGAAAGLYAVYHVGYGMGWDEMLFLSGLGVVYAIAYAQARNILVLWPLLTPVGSFFNNLRSGDIALPWASIAGFVDILALMAVAVWLAHHRQTRGHRVHVALRRETPADTGHASA